MRTRRQFLGATGGAAVIGALAGVVRPAAAAGSLDELLEPIREAHDLPALAGAVTSGGRTLAFGAIGVRKYGDRTPVAADDRFHTGSCTKAMTATLVGRLIEQGKLSWNSALESLFPDLAEKMAPAFRKVSVEMLLQHRAGFPGSTAPPGKTLLDLHRLPGSPREQRRVFTELWLKTPPASPPGTKYAYANEGYGILGAITERVMDEEWELLIGRLLFQPLGITTAGFGAMGTPGKLNQPWQHRISDGKHEPIPPGPRSDNPPVIGPGGRVHCSMADWAKFVALHAGESRGGLLKPETLKRLHTPRFGGDYAAGWTVTERSWGGGRVLNHSGSNTINYAVTWVAPLRDYAVLAATNQGGDGAAKACDEVCGALIGRFPPGK